jgi:hypothetical protein
MSLVSKSSQWAFAVAVLGIILSGSASPQSCKYTVKRTVKQTAGENDSKCQVTCSGVVEIQLPNQENGKGIIEGAEHQEIALKFAATDPLGGEDNALCGSNGDVNWGDGDEDEPFPSTEWNDCTGHIGTRIAALDSYTPEVVMKHTYAKAGSYCVSAKMFASRKDRHGADCAYECTLENSVRVEIKPESSSSAKTSK